MVRCSGREPSGDRQRARDVGGVERVALHAGVEQKQLARAERAVVASPVQRAGVFRRPPRSSDNRHRSRRCARGRRRPLRSRVRSLPCASRGSTSSKPSFERAQALRSSSSSYSSLIKRISERCSASSPSASRRFEALVDRRRRGSAPAAPDTSRRAARRDTRRSDSDRTAFVDAVVRRALLDTAVTADPEFAGDAIGEEFGFPAVVLRHEEQRAVARALGLEHQHRPRLPAARQICKVARGPKPEERVVGADALAPGRERRDMFPDRFWRAPRAAAQIERSADEPDAPRGDRSNRPS